MVPAASAHSSRGLTRFTLVVLVAGVLAIPAFGSEAPWNQTSASATGSGASTMQPTQSPEPTTPAITELGAAAAPAATSPVMARSIWDTAGAFVWHESAVDPAALGRELKDNGFGWVAVQLHD